MRKAKVHLAKEVKNNKKGFFKYVISKRKTRENVDLLLNEEGDLITGDAEKLEILGAFFASVLTTRSAPWESQTLEVRGLGNGRLPFGQARYVQRPSRQNQCAQISGLLQDATMCPEGAGRGDC